MLRRFSPSQIAIEISAQIRRVLDAGIRPTHIDSHQHLHVLPGVIDIVLSAAHDTGIPVIRIPRERGGVGGRGVPSRLLAYLSNRAARKADTTGLRYADHFWGFGVSGHMDQTALTSTLDRLRPGANEIMCHPGQSNPDTRYSWGYRWADELAALTSDETRAKINELGIILTNYAAVVA